MVKYKVQLQTLDMKEKSKEVIVELKDDEKPTPYNIISKRLSEYFVEHKEELGLRDNIEIARTVFQETNDAIEQLLYYSVEKMNE